ncbi:hypothetical protein [Accumulibacter sp.]|uniref:hypothetical protein n=1 Tax=Accumulibacter sp. TaxID=2053492 RepID=UPI002619661E|nr:hypothetical protein [Accumulibacter sp.]
MSGRPSASAARPVAHRTACRPAAPAGARLLLLALLAALLLLTGCATRLGKDGRSETDVHARYLVKSEADRLADTVRREVEEGLLRIADKLYKRNPREWKKTGLANRDAALERLRARRSGGLPELGGAREGPAAQLAFSETYAGDRVAALSFGLLSMADAAFDDKTDFYLFDSLDETKLYRCARNLEVAVWKLGNDRTAAGEPFLLANELDPARPNLSFEREFGRQIGLLDLLASVVADRQGRALSRLTQSAAVMVFLPIGGL